MIYRRVKKGVEFDLETSDVKDRKHIVLIQPMGTTASVAAESAQDVNSSWCVNATYSAVDGSCIARSDNVIGDFKKVYVSAASASDVLIGID